MDFLYSFFVPFLDYISPIVTSLRQELSLFLLLYVVSWPLRQVRVKNSHFGEHLFVTKKYDDLHLNKQAWKCFLDLWTQSKWMFANSISKDFFVVISARLIHQQAVDMYQMTSSDADSLFCLMVTYDMNACLQESSHAISR